MRRFLVDAQRTKAPLADLPGVEAIHMGSSVANCFGLEEAPSHTQPEPTVDATTLINPHHQAAGRIPTRCDPEDPEHKDVECVLPKKRRDLRYELARHPTKKRQSTFG
jgi:hypothetical protein